MLVMELRQKLTFISCISKISGWLYTVLLLHGHFTFFDRQKAESTKSEFVDNPEDTNLLFNEITL